MARRAIIGYMVEVNIIVGLLQCVRDSVGEIRVIQVSRFLYVGQDGSE